MSRSDRSRMNTSSNAFLRAAYRPLPFCSPSVTVSALDDGSFVVGSARRLQAAPVRTLSEWLPH